MQDLAAERGVLSGVAKFGVDAFDEISDYVSTNTLSDPDNQLFWTAFDYLCKNHNLKSIQFPDLCSAFHQLNLGEVSKPNVEYFRALLNTPLSLDAVKRHAAVIKRFEVARNLSEQHDISKSNLSRIRGDEPFDKIIAMSEGPIFDYTSKLMDSEEETSLMGEGMEEYALHLMDNPRELMGISTGLINYDRAIGGGLRPGGLDIIGARQKTGKTQIVDNVGIHIAKQMIPVLNLDTEMEKQEHQIRIAANLADVAIYDIETGKVRFRPEHKSLVLKAAQDVKKLPYYYRSIRGKAFDEIHSIMRRWVTRTVGLGPDGKANPCVIIYDYLKLMSAKDISKNVAEHQLLGLVTSGLKDFMGRYGVACLCFSQLNRDGIDIEDTSVMRGSDRILDTCTSFSIYKWKTEDERAEAGPQNRKYTHKIVNNFGRFGGGLDFGDYINIQSEYNKGRIIEGPLRSELEGQLDNTQKGIIVHGDPVDLNF